MVCKEIAIFCQFWEKKKLEAELKTQSMESESSSSSLVSSSHIKS
jgi:hypothetical protein